MTVLLLWVVLAVVAVVCLVLARFVFPEDPPARIFYAVGFVLLGVAFILFLWWAIHLASSDVPPATTTTTEVSP